VSEPTNIAPQNESAPLPEVLVLPADYFFVESVEVPTALAAGELADFAELSMEAIAPYPIEQLRWGFLVAPDGQHILVYAAVKDRLKRAGHGDLEAYTWVLPDFATLHGARFNRDTEVILHGEHYNTSLFHPSGEAMPENIRSLPKDSHPGTPATTDQSNKECPPKGGHIRMSAPLGAEQAKNAQNDQGQHFKTHPGTPGQSIQLRLLPVELSEKGTPIFQFETIGEAPAIGHWSPLEPDEATLWQADIRPATYKTVERSTRRTTALITRVMGYAALLAILLILLEGLILGGQLWLSTREAKIDAQTTSVRRIEDKQSLMNKLEQVAQNELRPIAILRAANNIRTALGETGITYNEVVVEDGNRLTVEGTANTINELNAYTESLRKSGNFKLVGDPKYITRSGETTFTVTLDYTHNEPTITEGGNE